MTKSLIPLFFFTALLLFVVPGSYASSKWEVRNDFGRYFDSAHVHGGILLYDPIEGKYLVYNRKRCDSAFIPASTYKIFNSLVGLETGAVKDENDTIKWDGTKYDNPEWNHDHTMRSAIKVSAVWFYQEIARRVGYKRMKYYIALAHYGNENIEGGIDQFWLEGKLRITPKQQIDLLNRLYRDKLPFSKRSMAIVRDIMIRQKTNVYIYRSKTGWADKIGWYVGYIERAGKPFFFAMNIDIDNDEDIKARITVTENILKTLKMID